MGTIEYMPPEAFEGVVSPAWDTWSAGVLLQKCFTGRLPYPFDTTQEYLARVIHDDPFVAEGVEEPFHTVIRGCLSKNRQKRWTAERALSFLNDWQRQQISPGKSAIQNHVAANHWEHVSGNEDIAEGNYSPAREFLAGAPRSRRKAFLMASGALVLFGLIGSGVWHFARGQQHSPGAPTAGGQATSGAPSLRTDPAAKSSQESTEPDRAGSKTTSDRKKLDAEGAVKQAAAAISRQDFRAAISQYRRALQLDPKNQEAKRGLANAEENQNVIVRQALDQAKGLYEKEFKYDEAIAILKRLLAVDSNSDAESLLARVTRAKQAEEKVKE